jgi:DNA-directed RNA polymerase subunit M/transcription elongation factor TFIIS
MIFLGLNMERKKISPVNFCPGCNMFLTYVQNPDIKDHLKYLCLTCGYTEEVPDDIVIHLSKESRAGVLQFNSHMIGDNSFLATSKIECTNKDCPSRVLADVVPEARMFADENARLKYACTKCGHITTH